MKTVRLTRTFVVEFDEDVTEDVAQEALDNWLNQIPRDELVRGVRIQSVEEETRSK